MSKPVVIAFYQADSRMNRVLTALVADLVVWANQEGYLLGAQYREQDGNGAFVTALDILATREDVAGVVVPSLAHLGPDLEQRQAAIAATGKQLHVARTP